MVSPNEVRNVAIITDDAEEERAVRNEVGGTLPDNVCYCTERKRLRSNDAKLHLIQDCSDEGPAKKKFRHCIDTKHGSSSCCKEDLVRELRKAVKDEL